MPQLFNDRRAPTPAEAKVTKGYAARWHGGSSYAEPSHDDLEHFPSRKAAREAFVQRRDSGYNFRQTAIKLQVAHDGVLTRGGEESFHTPSVDNTAYMDLHPIKADGTHDPDVFHRLQFGKRGGVQGQWS
jgi:hypothetical protein